MEVHSQFTQSLYHSNLKPNESKVFMTLISWIGNRKIPIEVKTLHLAKACGLTYKQTRTIIDNLKKYGLIEKWTASYIDTKSQLPRKSSYLRLKSY